MVSAYVTWKGATKPFFVYENGLKLNAKTYKKNLEKQHFPEFDRLMNSTSCNFLHDSDPSHHSNIVQNFLKEKLGSKFIKYTECPPSSPDCSPLEYHFWNKIKGKVYKGCFGQPFNSEDELKKKDYKGMVWIHARSSRNSLWFKAVGPSTCMCWRKGWIMHQNDIWITSIHFYTIPFNDVILFFSWYFID